MIGQLLRVIGCLVGLVLLGYGYDALALRLQDASLDQMALLGLAVAAGVWLSIRALLAVLRLGEGRTK